MGRRRKIAQVEEYYILEASERTRFVQNNWLEIGIYAYTAYMQAGRGAVVVSADSLKNERLAFRYFLRVDIEQGAPPEWVQYVNEYVPEVEAVVCFEIPGGAISAGRYEVINARPRDMWLAQSVPHSKPKGVH